MPTLLERFNAMAGPGVLSGITLGDWLRLLRDNRFRVHPRYLPRFMTISWSAVTNAPVRWYERWRHARALDDVEIPPPLFVLGHWRSGTTLLHDLFAIDRRFAFPNLYQVMYPHTFLTTEWLGSKYIRMFSPEHRPHDNMRLDPASAWEDEFVLCADGFRTPYLAWAFPGRAAHYDRFLTFRDAAPEDVRRWRDALLRFVRRVTLKYRRPLVLKSPTHTARVRLLLEMFPGAKFAHVHRDPYAVYKSFVHTHEKVVPMCRLQRGIDVDWPGRVIRQYKELYDAFLDERRLIPAGHFHEMRFADLESDPVGQVRAAYAALGLPDFPHVEPALRVYVATLAGYRKNVLPDLAPGVRARVAAEWARYFDEFGYPRMISGPPAPPAVRRAPPREPRPR